MPGLSHWRRPPAPDSLSGHTAEEPALCQGSEDAYSRPGSVPASPGGDLLALLSRRSASEAGSSSADSEGHEETGGTAQLLLQADHHQQQQQHKQEKQQQQQRPWLGLSVALRMYSRVSSETLVPPGTSQRSLGAADQGPALLWARLHLPRPGIRKAKEDGDAPGARNFFMHFKLGQALGQGATGTVRQCLDLRSGKPFACKVVEKGQLKRPSDLVRARTEFLLQRRMARHPHVVQARQLFENERSLHLVMEWCRGGNLFDLVDRTWPFSEDVAAAIFAQVAEGVRACHEKLVLHRDLKLENILAVEEVGLSSPHPQRPKQAQLLREQVPRLKIADFGSAISLHPGEQIFGWMGGSTMYQAPEVLNGNAYDYSSDVWSLGVILYILLCGFFPFTAPTDALVAGMVKRGVLNVSGPQWNAISAEASSLVLCMLQMNPSMRSSISDVCQSGWLSRHRLK